MSITINTLANLQSHQILGVQFYSPDYREWIGWLKDAVAEELPNIPVFLYSQSLKLCRFLDNGIEQSEVFAEPDPGIDPASHYLQEYYQYTGSGIFIFTDLAKYFYQKSTNSYHKLATSYLRTITTTVNENNTSFKRLIFLDEKIDLAPELIRLIPIIDFPLPNQPSREIAIESALKAKSVVLNKQINIPIIAKASAGLTLTEIDYQVSNHYHYNSLDYEEITEESLLNHLISYKTSLLKKLKIEVVNPRETQFGGHELLRNWLDNAYQLMQPEMEQYGLPKYKGCLLAGVSGCGKTLVAETIAHQWNLPLIKLSIPSLKGGLVGQSENNLKNALKLIENIEGVLLIDEIEKTISGRGTDSSGVSDGMLSILLDWMNIQKNQFVVATANDVTRLPSEILRSGRMNERWFVDLPGCNARKQILEIHLYQNPQRVDSNYRSQIDKYLDNLVDRTTGYSGAELEEIVLRGLRQAIIQQRPKKPEFKDFIADLPAKLSQSHPEQHQAIIQWGKNARPTSKETDG